MISAALGFWLSTCAVGQSPAVTQWTEIKASIVAFEVRELTILPNGTATYSFLDFGTFKKQPLQRRKLPVESLRAVEQAINESEFATLPSSVGRLVYSLAPCDIQVKYKNAEKSVRLLCPHDPLPATDLELNQERRARKLWKVIWDLEPLFRPAISSPAARQLP